MEGPSNINHRKALKMYENLWFLIQDWAAEIY
jgi:hypothetical protein